MLANTRSYHLAGQQFFMVITKYKITAFKLKALVGESLHYQILHVGGLRGLRLANR